MAGNDLLHLTAGDDILNGGAGTDVFVVDGPVFDSTINGFDANPVGGQESARYLGTGDYGGHVRHSGPHHG